MSSVSTPIEDEIEVEEEFYKPKPRNDDTEMDITPMIDITFLLLIFFLVTSKMTAEETPELPSARHGMAVPSKESVVVIATRGTGSQAQVKKSDGTLFSSDLEQQAAEIAEYVAKGLESGKKYVVVKAEGAVRHGEIGRICKAISDSLEEGQMINLGVLEAH